MKASSAKCLSFFRVNRDLVHTLEDWLVMLPGDLLAMPEPKDQSGLKQMMSLIASMIIQKRSPLKLVDSLGISISHVVCMHVLTYLVI